MVDTRTDIWAFGCVLFELLSGVATFGGETVSDTVAAVLTREPDWTKLPPHTPETLKKARAFHKLEHLAVLATDLAMTSAGESIFLTLRLGRREQHVVGLDVRFPTPFTEPGAHPLGDLLRVGRPT